MNWWVNHWNFFDGKERILATLLLCIFVFGSIGINLSATKDWFEPLSAFTLLYAFFALLFTHKNFTLPFIGVMIFSFSVGMAIEIIGVKTGVVFGKYEYTNMLGTQLMSVPLIIGVNWISLTYATNNIASHFIQHKYFAVIVAAIAMVGFDVLIEPLAVKHHFWIWSENGLPPIQNYISWFVVSLVLSFTYQKAVQSKLNFMAVVFSIGLLFFLVTDLIL